MFAEFETYIKAQAHLSDSQLELVKAAAVEKKIARKQCLLREGEVCRYKLFVVKGLLRMYRTTADGNEHILQFSPQSSWTTEAESYHSLAPSHYYIDALEDTEVLMWAKSDFDQLLIKISDLRKYSEQLVSQNLVLSRHRIFNTISLTPEQKYDDFMEAYPGIISRVPLRMIASYLGMSLKTLSRIRHAQLLR